MNISKIKLSDHLFFIYILYKAKYKIALIRSLQRVRNCLILNIWTAKAQHGRILELLEKNHFTYAEIK